MTLLRMDNVGIVVDDLESAIAFFVELGLEPDGGPMSVEGPWVDDCVGLDGTRSRIAMLRMPDGAGRLELACYENPEAVVAQQNPPANTLGLHRVMFAVTDLADTLARLKAKFGAEPLRAVARFEDAYLLCYLRGPSGIVVGLAQPLGPESLENAESL